jgi:hypothetical protein
MRKLIDTWFPTSLNGGTIDGVPTPKIPVGQKMDLLGLSQWNKTMAKIHSDNKDHVTSCGDVLTTMLKLWKTNILGALNFRDKSLKLPIVNGYYTLGPGAIALGIYTKADGIQSPQPGDLLILRDGDTLKNLGVGHVTILYDIIDPEKGSAWSALFPPEDAPAGGGGDGGDDPGNSGAPAPIAAPLVQVDKLEWWTADGGGGIMPNQVCKINRRPVTKFVNGIPVLHSPTDGKDKLLDGWISLDKLKQTGSWTIGGWVDTGTP